MTVSAIAALSGALALIVPQAATAAQGQQARSEQQSPQKRTCKTYTVTGSRLATKKVCGTAEEWADRRLQDRQVIEKVQVGPCVLQTTGATGRPGC